MTNALTGGKLFIVSAPSGSGKTTLCKKLLADGLGLVPSVSVTTRPPRPDEVDGVDYHFVSEKAFREMAEGDEFLEYEENFGNSYGTPRRFIEDSLKEGRRILLSIDVKGATKVKARFPEESVTIFILPPSLPALRKRLEARMAEDLRRSGAEGAAKADSAETIETRLKLAEAEISHQNKYDHRIVNDALTGAYQKLKKVIIAESVKG